MPLERTCQPPRLTHVCLCASPPPPHDGCSVAISSCSILFRQGQEQGGDAGGAGGVGNGNEYVDEGLLPPSIARAWRTFDVAKQIEYETKEQQKAEKARVQKKMQVITCPPANHQTLNYFEGDTCGARYHFIYMILQGRGCALSTAVTAESEAAAACDPLGLFRVEKVSNDPGALAK